MDHLIKTMYEDFIMSEVCSNVYAFLGNEDSEAQDLNFYIKCIDHASLCKKAAEVCLDYLKTKNEKKLLLEFRILGLYKNIQCIKDVKMK